MRKHRTDSGLISYDARRDTEWLGVAREIIAAEKPKFIVMMVGNNDRQSIREKVPPPPPSGAPKANAPPAPSPVPGGPPVRPDPEQQQPEAVERHSQMTPEQARRPTAPGNFTQKSGSSPTSSESMPPLRHSKAPVCR